MKWIGQHIYDLISRFRSDVYLEDVSTGTIASGGNLGLDSNNKIVKATVSASVTDLHDAGVDGSANQLLTDDGDGSVTSESNLTFDGANFLLESSTADSPTIKLTNTTDDNEGSQLIFEKLRADDGVASGQNIGEIWFRGQDSAQNTEDYAYIFGEIDVSTGGQESGQLKFGLANHDGGNGSGLILTGGSADNEIDVTVGLGAASVTTITGTLTMGSTAAMTNAGLLSVANQSNITGLGTISSGTWQGTAIASAYLDSDTAHLSGVQTFAGSKSFTASLIAQSTLGSKLTVYGDGAGIPGDGMAIHVDGIDFTDNATSESATTAKYTHVNIENPRLLATNASVTTTDAATLYVKGAPVASTNQTISNTWSLWVDAGNARFDGSIYSGSTEAINSSGVVQVAAQTVIDHDQLANYAANEHFTQANITTVGTIGTGVWQGTAIASAYLDSDTAHLTTNQTFTGVKTFNEAINKKALHFVYTANKFTLTTATETYFSLSDADRDQATGGEDGVAVMMVCPLDGVLKHVIINSSSNLSAKTWEFRLYRVPSGADADSGGEIKIATVASNAGPASHTNKVISFVSATADTNVITYETGYDAETMFTAGDRVLFSLESNSDASGSPKINATLCFELDESTI